MRGFGFTESIVEQSALNMLGTLLKIIKTIFTRFRRGGKRNYFGAFEQRPFFPCIYRPPCYLNGGPIAHSPSFREFSN